ncbi:MAG: DODA-type extradiol aromatic ring-opening family dioxygenase [Methylophilus sp.]|uniref:DODA-type extradiol aromatic ring-opening family dioxygenase n=1 Tax=Methylophilus sp. TaxID=29541 RepID=UPI003F9F736B
MTTLFVSHGAPSLILEPGETGQMLVHLAASLPKPDAILVISAHWDTRVATVSLASHQATIHDFSGFPAPLYEIQYPAPGAPALAHQVVALLQASGIAVHAHAERGLDHGAWVPLALMYPAADIPVTQLSIQSRSTPAQQFALGQALQPLHAQNVLILASGAVTHNLSDFFSANRDAAPLSYVASFADWVAGQLSAQEAETLLNYRQESDHGIQAHPSEDHLMPLFVAAGSGQGVPKRFTPETTYGILAMDAYVWQN